MERCRSQWKNPQKLLGRWYVYQKEKEVLEWLIFVYKMMLSCWKLCISSLAEKMSHGWVRLIWNFYYENGKLPGIVKKRSFLVEGYYPPLNTVQRPSFGNFKMWGYNLSSGRLVGWMCSKMVFPRALLFCKEQIYLSTRSCWHCWFARNSASSHLDWWSFQSAENTLG